MREVLKAYVKKSIKDETGITDGNHYDVFYKDWMYTDTILTVRSYADKYVTNWFVGKTTRGTFNYHKSWLRFVK